MALNCWHIPTNEEEVVAVFCEEVGELLDNIDNHMKTWMGHPENKKALTEIRRCFHTIKGSGRMVRALDLSELAWKIENMLNQVIAGIVPISEPMVKLVGSVRNQIPKMVDAFKNQRSLAGNGDIVRSMKLADTLAAERAPEKMSPPRTITLTEQPQHIKLHEVNLKLERCMQRADEALHRSEMALQEARQQSTSKGDTFEAMEQRQRRGEAERIDECVDRLSQKIAELSARSGNGEDEPIRQNSNIGRLIEQRLRVDLATIELLGTEIKRNIEENHRTAAAIRRYGWLALILSALTGGVLATGLIMSILSLG